jgi:aminoacyl tRNA synthase complex-interacting multifunctional protein 1
LLDSLLQEIGRFGAKMASSEMIKKLETRAMAAEQIISLLKDQMFEIKASAQNSAYSAEIEQLKAENSKLKDDIQLWTKKLTQAEINNGKKVFSHPTVSCSAASTPPTQVKEEKKEKSVEKEAPKSEKKVKPPKEKKEPKKEVEEAPVDVGRLDMRVGHIRKATKHPDADALYVDEIDCGEEKARTVISGLVKFIPEEQMQDRMVVVLCNLKPSKMRGIMSEAMVMCASTPDKVEILAPPPGSKLGDVVLVEGFTRNPDAQLNPKKKIFEACAPDLKVNSNKEATYKGVKWAVNGQPVTSQSLTEVQVK